LDQKAKVYYLRIPRRAVALLLAAMLLPWAVVLFVTMRPEKAAVAQASPAPALSAAEVLKARTHVKPGPWGTLEYVDIKTQPPDEFISPNLFGGSHPRWVFKGFSKSAVEELFAACGLNEAQHKSLSAAIALDAAKNECVVTPDDEVLFGLASDARARVYSVLAKSPENSAQRDPFIFKKDMIGPHLDASGLNADTITQIKKLLYPSGDLVLLADIGTIARRVTDVQERSRLFRTLLQRVSMFLRLRLAPDSDIKALTDYWGRGGRATAVAPLLESLQNASSPISVDVTLLLPTFARTRLYTYPFPSSKSEAAAQDCHWSALNFFNETVDDRFTKPDVVRSTIEKEYYPVPGSPAFGDLALLSTPEGAIVHSAVFIADDVFFTKNGASYISPWLLVTQHELMDSFPAYEKLQMVFYRMKKL
jgi:hypothetical protein